MSSEPVIRHCKLIREKCRLGEPGSSTRRNRPEQDNLIWLDVGFLVVFLAICFTREYNNVNCSVVILEARRSLNQLCRFG